MQARHHGLALSSGFVQVSTRLLSDDKRVPAGHLFFDSNDSAPVTLPKVFQRQQAGSFAQLAFVAAGALWVMWVGKDLGWDVVNHHLYLPFSLLSGRFATDLFAAGPQSYQNPIGYLPFYALVRANPPDWAVGCALALIHGLAAWPLWRLITALWGEAEAGRFWRLLALLAAWAAPIYLLLLGSSSVDPLCNVLVLVALSCLMVPGLGLRASVAGGMALGLAFAIKPVSAVFVLALVPLACLRLAVGQMKLQQIVAFGAAAGVVAIAGMAGWSLWLWQSFGNPMFPLFNQWFESPYAPQSAVVAGRFLPNGPLDYVSRLLVFAQFRTFTYTESFVPDIRPLAAAAAGLLAAVTGLWVGTNSLRAVASRVDVQLAIFVVLAYVLWMLTSGNGRYALPLFMLCGPLLMRGLQLGLPRRVGRITAGVLVALQLLYYIEDGDHRYLARQWDGGPYLDVRPSPRLVKEPFLHLSVGSPSFAVVAPFLHPDGAFVNVTGPMSLPTEGPLGAALKQRLQQWAGRTRVLFRPSADHDDPIKQVEFRVRADWIVYRFGLRFDWQDCESLNFHEGRALHDTTGAVPPGIDMLSCNVLPRQDVDLRYARELAVAERAFSVIQNQCPKVFGPVPMATDGDPDAWQRRYVNTDARATVSLTEGVSISHFRSRKIVTLGSVEDVIAGRGIPACKAWADLEIE